MAGPRLRASSLLVVAAAQGRDTAAAAAVTAVCSPSGMGIHDRLTRKLNVVAAGVECYFLNPSPLRDDFDL